MPTRRAFVARSPAPRCSPAFRPDALRRVGAVSPPLGARRRRPGRRGLLGRDPAGVRLRPHDGQSQQRRVQPHPDPRAGADDPGPPVLQRAPRHPHVADPGAPHRERPARAGPELRLRSRGDGHHPERLRGQRDHDPRSRSQGGRRGDRHQSELWPRCSPPGISGSGATASCSSRSSFKLPPPSQAVPGRSVQGGGDAADPGHRGHAHHQPDRPDHAGPGADGVRPPQGHRGLRGRRPRLRALPLLP